MKRREDERNVDENLWDKTFEDNQDLGRDGHLSRLEHRKQSSAASRFTTILVVLIIILAATPVLYWINHEKSFNHPTPKLEQVAKGSTEHKKKSGFVFVDSKSKAICRDQAESRQGQF